MPTFFCPKCWKEVKEGCEVCPNCGFNLRSFDRMKYEDKLISALNHPIDEFKINAIGILGRIGSDKAVKALEDLALKETSVPVILKVIDSLKMLGENYKAALNSLKKLERHRAKVVSKAAKLALKEFERAGELEKFRE